MLDRAKELTGYKLNALDGEIGSVKEFYFDDQHWAIRYLVADTGGWLAGRRVLISPYALQAVSKQDHHLVVGLSRKQIEDSPSLDSDKPVSRQFENAYYGYFGWPAYWGGPYMWGSYPAIARDRSQWRDPAPGESAWDPHLRSTHDVIGHHIQATDGEIGHVEDFIIDDDTWAIRYLIIDTRNWWPGKKVLVSPQWIDRVSWKDSTVYVNLTRETIKHAPEYTEQSLLTRDYESGLHRHYDRRGYWVEDPAVTHHTR
ncbi:MAG: PRC-barrel domain-containing protein [Gemmatimonadota bacterium]